MNIFSGQFKGRKIKTIQELNYRPTKSIVRKSIFDSLSPYNYDVVLDLFSGSGILGFEAASRGAKIISFVENNRTALKLLKENAEILHGPDYKFYHKSVLKYFEPNFSFDLIFADPPYGKIDLIQLVDIILGHLNKKGKFILECDKKQVPFMDAKVKDFGNTRLLYWENS